MLSLLHSSMTYRRRHIDSRRITQREMAINSSQIFGLFLASDVAYCCNKKKTEAGGVERVLDVLSCLEVLRICLEVS
jgi:hypothetical protein